LIKQGTHTQRESETPSLSRDEAACRDGRAAASHAHDGRPPSTIAPSVGRQPRAQRQGARGTSWSLCLSQPLAAPLTERERRSTRRSKSMARSRASSTRTARATPSSTSTRYATPRAPSSLSTLDNCHAARCLWSSISPRYRSIPKDTHSRALSLSLSLSLTTKTHISVLVLILILILIMG